jgi:hypothetical protein
MTDNPELPIIMGSVKDQKRWWVYAGKENRAFFMSKDRGKRGVHKKRFK